MAIDNYLNNITSQHRDKPKFISWLSENLIVINHTYLLLKSMDDNFDLDNAIGVQLDILGEIIGRKRTLTFQPLNGYGPIMDDKTYRLALKAKTAMNNWNGTIPQMYEIWDDIFGEDNDLSLQIQDNQDMSFNAFITGYVDQIQQDLIQHGYIVPKTEGVQVNYIQKNPVAFTPYLGMIVSSCKKEVINMSYNPTEIIKFVNNSSIITGGIITSTINLKEKKVNL
jgi:hypothetical protein